MTAWFWLEMIGAFYLGWFVSEWRYIHEARLDRHEARLDRLAENEKWRERHERLCLEEARLEEEKARLRDLEESLLRESRPSGPFFSKIQEWASLQKDNIENQ